MPDAGGPKQDAQSLFMFGEFIGHSVVVLGMISILIRIVILIVVIIIIWVGKKIYRLQTPGFELQVCPCVGRG